MLTREKQIPWMSEETIIGMKSNLKIYQSSRFLFDMIPDMKISRFLIAAKSLILDKKTHDFLIRKSTIPDMKNLFSCKKPFATPSD
jgi:hypothetical protein